MINEVEIIKASLLDLSGLQEICKETYSTYFSDYWESNGLELYLENQFGNNRLKTDLRSASIEYYFISINKKHIGFLKINLDASFDALRTENTCELEKMYLYPRFKGMGIGKLALNMVISKISVHMNTTLFLDVLETNESSILFYENLGFKFHCKTQVKAPYFKSELNGLNRMVLYISQKHDSH